MTKPSANEDCSQSTRPSQKARAAIVAMSGKLKEQQHELSKLKNECNAAYRAAAVASREELDKERDKTEAAEVRAEEAERSVALRIRDLENGVVQAHEQIAEERRKTATVQNGLEQSEALHTLLKAARREFTRGGKGGMPRVASIR